MRPVQERFGGQREPLRGDLEGVRPRAGEGEPAPRGERNLEAQLSEERKKLREANLTIHRLQRDANATETSLSRRSVVDVDRSAEPVSSTVHEPRDNDDALSVSSSRRIPSDSASQTSYRDRYPSRFSPVGFVSRLERSGRRDRT